LEAKSSVSYSRARLPTLKQLLHYICVIVLQASKPNVFHLIHVLPSKPRIPSRALLHGLIGVLSPYSQLYPSVTQPI